MLAAHADRAWRRPWLVLGVALALAAGFVAVAIGAPDDLGIGSQRLADPPRATAPADAELVVVLEGHGGPESARLLDVSEEVVAAQVASDPAIAAVRAVDRDDGTVTLVARFGDVDDAERQQAVVRLSDAIDPGPARATVSGEVERLLEARRELTDDLWRPELLVLPLALLVAVAAAGFRRALAPVLCAVIAIAGSLALLRGIGLVVDVSLLGFAPAAAIGLVLGVELPLLMIRRHDDWEWNETWDEATRSTIVQGARSALRCGAVAALPGLALLATPLEQAPSLALGCALAALLAALASVLVAPAVLRLARVRVADPPRLRRPFARWAARLARSRASALAAFVIAAAILCALGSPMLDATSAPFAVLAPAPGDSLFGELPLAAAIAATAIAVAAAAVARAPQAVALGPASLLPAAAGVGVCALVFQEGNLVEALDSEAQDALDTAAVAVALCSLAAIGAARSVAALHALRYPGHLSLTDEEATIVGARLTLAPATAATVVGVLGSGALIATELYPARELGLALAVGLLADLIVLRAPLLAFASRWIGWVRAWIGTASAS